MDVTNENGHWQADMCKASLKLYIFVLFNFNSAVPIVYIELLINCTILSKINE